MKFLKQKEEKVLFLCQYKYQKLIKSAKERICISSLYLGTGKMEEFIVDNALTLAK